MPGGLRLEWERDVAGRPTARRTTRRDAGAVGPSPLPRELDVLVYQWRGEDQIGALIDPNRGARFFDHDRRGRLIRERRNGATLERAMDPAGNVYRRADRADRRYGPGGVLLEAEAPGGEGTVRYTHDADGNQTERLEPDGTRWRYRYDRHGLLRDVERVPPRAADAGPLPPPDLRLSFAYDAFARRVEKTVVALGPDGEEQSRRETRFVWDGHVVAHELDSQDGLTTWYWEPDTFTPVAKESAGRYYSIASDHLGTPTEMYDELGELAWRMQLDVFGVPTFEAGGASDCPWRWPGQYEDVETGEYYNRWRWYDSRRGRFTTGDPIGPGGGLNLYGYVPCVLLWTDPHGLARTPLRGGDIDAYGNFNAAGRVGDGLAGHELLQNAWLQAHGYNTAGHGVGAASRGNPAVALGHDAHRQVSRAQRDAGLFRRSNLLRMRASENIARNAQILRELGTPEYQVRVLEREARQHAARVLWAARRQKPC
ncbi:MAG: RHS domain-containing protein [Sandaracinaceae bacterium]|nr:RHS domain-containing protein [Sandaracinaceae bacterium]